MADQQQNSEGRGRSLRVCFISHQYPPALIGGIGRFTADLAAGFAAAGHDVHVVSTQGGVCGTTLENNVSLHRLPSFPALPDALKQEQAGPYLARIASVYRKVAQLHREKPFDIISSPIFLAEGLLIANDPRFATIVSLHTSSSWKPEAASRPSASSPLTELEMQCIRAHSHTHANSHAAVDKITAEYAAPNGVFVIPHGVNDMSPSYARERRDDGRVRVLLVGLLDKRKGADVLHDIIPRILTRFPVVEFTHVGMPFPMREFGGATLPAVMQKRFRNRPDILQRVHFAGVVSDEEVYRSYANADLLLVPSRYESFGLMVTEAMSFALPVVAWKAGGICETVVDGETGILVDVEDHDGLIEAVGQLATDAALRRKYGATGRKRYLSHFSTTTSIPRTIDAYRKIAQASPCFDENDHARGALVARFADIIAAMTAARGTTALETAQRLIVERVLEQPRTNVILNCFNAAEDVVATLDSVRAQTYRNFRCVVVDDASSDGSAEIVADWLAEKQDERFSLQRNDLRQGPLACIAAGLAASDGELVGLLDAGDIWFADFLRLHVGVVHATSIAASRSERARVGHPTETSGGSPPVKFESPGDLPHSDGTASSMLLQRSFLEAVMPRDVLNPKLPAQAYVFALCHHISGSFVIDRPLATFTDRAARATWPASEQANDIIIARAQIRHLLDYPPKLASLVSARRRDVLLRTLVRRCLRAGVAIDDRRVYEVLGSRVWRDRLRAKVWFLRQRLF